MSNEIRLGIIGNVDSGKSTFIGVYKSGILDNGRGSARRKILKHPHEQDSGRTSSVTQESIKINNKKSLVFIDLAGHEKYLKTTLHGLSGYFIDYCILMIGANMGVSKMTREHLSITLALDIPFIVIITKTDIAPENIYNNTKKVIVKMISRMTRRRKKNKIPIFVNSENDFENISNNKVPIFSISNKTGENLDLVKNYLMNLKNTVKINKSNKFKTLFSIEDKYIVSGVGTVITGKLLYGNIKKNQKLYIGPLEKGWVEITTKSFHDNFRNPISELKEGETGTIAIKIHGKNDILKKRTKNLRKGFVLIDSDSIEKLHHYYFEAIVKILVNHSTTIQEKYEPIINCNTIVQAAKIEYIDNKNKILRAGDKCVIKFRFCYKPEFIKENDIFIFREGKTKGIGVITKVGK